MDVPPQAPQGPPSAPPEQPPPMAGWPAPTGAPIPSPPPQDPASAWPPQQQPTPPGPAYVGPAALAPPRADQGSWWMRALFNLCLLEVGMALCALAFGLSDSDELDASFGIWLLTNIFVLPTAVLYGGMVEGIGRVIPSPGWRRALAVGLAPIGGAMGMLFGLNALFGDSDQLLGLVFVLPVFVVGALWRVPTQHVRPLALYALAGAVVLSLVALGLAVALAPADEGGGFYCC